MRFACFLLLFLPRRSFLFPISFECLLDSIRYMRQTQLSTVQRGARNPAKHSMWIRSIEAACVCRLNLFVFVFLLGLPGLSEDVFVRFSNLISCAPSENTPLVDKHINDVFCLVASVVSVLPTPSFGSLPLFFHSPLPDLPSLGSSPPSVSASTADRCFINQIAFFSLLFCLIYLGYLSEHR